MKILIADDETSKRVTLAHDLAAQGHEVVAVGDGGEAIAQLASGRFDVMVTDLKMPKVGGLDLLRHIKQGPLADMEVIIMTAYGSIPVAVEAVKMGAFDFLTKPFRNEDIFPVLARIQRARKTVVQQPSAEQGAGGAIGQWLVSQSAAMGRVKRMIEICARTDANVLLYGETGVGKDLIASVIHQLSHRSGFPFVKVGCTLFPPQLIESELYGHVKGSFTGADRQRLGRFELAEGGSLYLDDVDDIPLEQQPKLLRAIEEKIFERVGSTEILKANVRIIASAKQNLMEKIAAGSYRQDLYYRLDVLRITVPPLRDRREDIPLLAEHLLARIAHGSPCRLEPAVVEVLQQHNWPGNVRELAHVLERAYLMGNGQITVELASAEVAEMSMGTKAGENLAGDMPRCASVPAGGAQTTLGPLPQSAPESVSAAGFQAVIDQAERELLESALRAAGGNKTAAAAALQMKPSTFRDKLAKHGLG